MSNGSNQHRRGRSHERSPLIPHNSSTSYDTFVHIPGSPGSQPPPPYEPTDGGECQGTSANQRSLYSPPLDPAASPKSRPTASTRKRWLCFGGFVVFFIILVQAVVLIFFYDLPSKLDAYGKATAQMREQRDAMAEQAKHLENKRIALQNENFRLGREREALESSTRKMSVEKGALESAIRRSELERSRLEQEKQLLEDKRQSLAQEKEELREEGRRLREERKKWEKAREDRVPPGAFWGVIRPAEDCRAYGTREYRATLQNIPGDWTNLDACMNMPVEIKGVSIRRPLRCEYVADFPHIQAIWMVNWDQPDCKPWHNEITDTGCTNPGSGTRRLEAWVVGINDKPTQDWRLLCETTPMTWNHITYNSPTHCEAGWFGKKFAVWEISDENC